MGTQRVTDDLDRLLGLLPDAVQEQLQEEEARQQLLEVVLDLGRLPEARYPGRALALGSTPLSREDLAAVVARIGQFGGDNRAGIERTLHRISAIRNRQGEVIGLTCRVGRAVFGTVAMVRDLLDGGQSLLLMGRPGVGKTTALREIARVLADELERRVVVIDTSNEIAGDGDIPHPAIGRARRMQVARPELQHQTMIEAVENHMPEVIVIDEIGTELEAQAARTIAERGVVLVATAHGNALANLIKNPTLSDLVGGIQAVTLGDEEARRRRSQKTVLERAADPTFPVAVEMHSRHRWAVHTDVAATVDQLLRGLQPRVQERELTAEGGVQLVDPPQPSGLLSPPSPRPAAGRPVSVPVSVPQTSAAEASPPAPPENTDVLQVLCCGITPRLVDETIRSHGWTARVVDDLSEADVVLSIRLGLSRQPSLRRQARDLGIPILVIKSDTLPQVTRAMARLLSRRASETAADAIAPDRALKDDEFAALEECRLAVEQVVMPQGRPVELLPRTERVLRMQADLVSRYQLRSDVFGQAEQSRLRVFPP
ncbi:AAA family ATPase [Synechococcus sp. HB1133]|uniref:AAA family ATPase n=1 Tax=unclassified Synechococcus TaxID=2626047 RepID=UPI00140E5207|nr:MULTISPECIES: AAA family ATPase [unclassified Synechococcus]MCB4395566.1 AAA family ATPase [Synechococcus sp. PH41509]MCB4423013.1 AAA family ATPase [Synechococcus sp. HB1133]MCB4431653.1 AAA family ATPase [Synechococcus sp. HBA1120]NHI81961.1 AAA family ATPase [Synechococcus sp. HB1133]